MNEKNKGIIMLFSSITLSVLYIALFLLGYGWQVVVSIITLSTFGVLAILGWLGWNMATTSLSEIEENFEKNS